MDAATFTREMARLAAAFGVELTDARAAVYLERLGGVDGETFRLAVDRALDEWTYGGLLPPIGVLKGHVREILIATGRLVDGATAWAIIDRKILAPFPNYQTGDWPDDLASEVFRAELGLPYDIARLESEYDRNRARDRFVKAYDRARAARDAALPAPTLRAIGGGR